MDQLHTAAKSNDLEKVKLLLGQGVDMHCKNEKGLTALHVLVQERLNMVYLTQHTSKKSQMTKKDEKDQLARNEEIINLLLENDTTGYDCPDFLGLTHFHVACMLQDFSSAECLSDRVADINHSVNQDSPIYAGYTALHFAAYCNINTFRMLLRKGASLLVKDVEGHHPFELCGNLLSIKKLHSLFKLVPTWRDIVFSDGKTKLVDYIFSLRDPVCHKDFLRNTNNISEASLPDDSPLWPGFTILHIATTLLPKTAAQIITDILDRSADIILKQDRQRATAIHLAFRQDKMDLVELIMNHEKNITCLVDEDDLSLLHVAVAAGICTRRLLTAGADVNVAYKGKPLPKLKPGWTTLHVAVAAMHSEAASALLEKGANLLQTDARGFSPVHLLLGTKFTVDVANVFFASNQLRECVVEGVGLSHLHVAVYVRNCGAIERLLDMGSDIGARIGRLDDEKLSRFEGCSPIDLALMDRGWSGVFELLVRRGADVFARRFKEPSIFYEVMTCTYTDHFLAPIVDLLWSSEELQRKIEEETGVKMLNLVCYTLDQKKIRELLERGVDVNARMREDSCVWPGFTPLHMLALETNYYRMNCRKNTPEDIVTLLLEKKANVTAVNSKGDTPVHMALETREKSEGISLVATLMKYHLDFRVNPVNEAGMSHFHAACLLKDAKAVENFLKQAPHIDLNRAIRSGIYAGCTPLTMALGHLLKKDYNARSQVQVVNLLLERGANVHAVETSGYTALHQLADGFAQTRDRLLDKILIDDTNVNRRANDGKTPLELFLHVGAPGKQIKFIVDRGGRINSYNTVSEVGYMAIVLSNRKYEKSKETSTILGMMLNSVDIAEVDANGRNAIHNAVTTESTTFMSEDAYVDLFHKLMELGCDVHQKDDRGRTALHLAFKFKNKEAVLALLMCGLDIDEIDATGLTPPLHALHVFNSSKWNKHGLHDFLTVFLEKSHLLGLEMSQKNASLLLEMRKKYDCSDLGVSFNKASFELQVEMTKNIKIGQRGLSVYDFLCPTRVLTYSSLLPTEREAFNMLMNSFDKQEFNEVWHLVKVQCRKALDRPYLVAQASPFLKVWFRYPLPDLCVNVILKSLNNSDLRSFNSAMIRDDDEEMTVV